VTLLKSNILREKIITQYNLLPVLFSDQWDDNTKNWEKRAWYNPPGGCLSENSQQPQANII
jgi:hypothetical protein